MPQHYHATIYYADGSPTAKVVSESLPYAARWGLRQMRFMGKVTGLKLLRTNHEYYTSILRGSCGKSTATIRTKVQRHYGTRCGRQQHMLYTLSLWGCYGDCVERAVPIMAVVG